MFIATPPGPAAVVTVRLCGAEDAVVEIRGAIDDPSCRRVGVLLWALLDTGALRVIVDVTAAREVPNLLLDALAALRTELRRRGGWLLVEGQIEDAGEPAALLEAFDAYRRTLPIPAVPVDALLVGSPS